MKRLREYLRARLLERSTWVGIGAAIAGAAALPSPYSWLCIAAGIVAAIAPERPAGSGA